MTTRDSTRTKTESKKNSIQLERQDDLALLWIDVPGESTNPVSPAFVDEMNGHLTSVEEDEQIRGAVFISRKKSAFIAGADLRVLEELQEPQAGARMATAGQLLLERIDKSTKPFVAAIHGACLGGGLELALACHARIITTSKVTRLGLPEVQVGVIPGAGGTQRLPRLIGLEAALDLILTGRQVDAQKAKRLGLASDAVTPSILLQAAKGALRELLVHGAKKKTRRARNWSELGRYALTSNPISRKVIFDQAQQRVVRKTRGNYPAPLRAIEVMQTGLTRGWQAGLAAEAQAFGELAVTPQAKELIALFFATRDVTPKVDAAEHPEPTQKVGVLGAGLMGAGIAHVTAARAGIPVRLKDVNLNSVGMGIGHIRGAIAERVTRKRLTQVEAERIMARVSASASYRHWGDVDLVIEAVYEDLNLKQEILQAVESHTSDTTIFASNTSAIPIADIAARAKRPAQVIGMHYFSPVEKMPLLELVTHQGTAPWVTRKCIDLGKKQGKTVIVVKDGPGFYTTRVLASYINEAIQMVATGYRVEDIDGALTHFGFPLGPLKLLDEVGTDVGAKVVKKMHQSFPERFPMPSALEKLVAQKRLGRRGLLGFYVYDEQKESGKRVDPSVYEAFEVTGHPEAPADELAERCALAMVNEAVKSLEDGICSEPKVGDVGAVMGLGFPPFRGGPFRHVDAVGADYVVTRLETFDQRFGHRFRPAELLVRMAREGKKFYE